MTLAKGGQWVVREVEDDFLLAGLWIMITMLSVVPAKLIPQFSVDVTNAVLIGLCTTWTAWGILGHRRRGRAFANAIISVAVNVVASIAFIRRDTFGVINTQILSGVLIGFPLGAYVSALGLRFFKRA